MNNQVTQKRRERRVLASVTIGQVIEWYDFFIYGTAAALVFGQLFFPNASPLTGTLLSFATFGVAFIARPLGGIIFGHIGDKYGRKPALVTTFILMGVASGCIGLLPTFDQIGAWAPVLLTIMRLLQGISVGGEYGGAVLMSVEHAPKGKRSFFGSFVQLGTPIGLIFANGVFLLMAVPAPEAFAAWGWRVPFLVSFALVVVGLFVRMRLEESPEFEKAVEKAPAKTRAQLPLAMAFRTQKAAMLLTAGTYLSCGAITYTTTVYGIKYATQNAGFSFGEALGMVVLAQLVGIVMVPLAGRWGDRFGMRLPVVLGTIGCALMVFPWLGLLSTGSFALGVLGYALLALPYYLNYGVLSTFFAVAFPTRVGYSGFSLGYQFGTIISSGIAPTVATLLLATTGTINSVGWYLVAMCIISILSALYLGRGKTGTHNDTLESPALAGASKA